MMVEIFDECDLGFFAVIGVWMIIYIGGQNLPQGTEINLIWFLTIIVLFCSRANQIRKGRIKIIRPEIVLTSHDTE